MRQPRRACFSIFLAMSVTYILGKIAAALLLPPVCFVLPAVAGFMMGGRAGKVLGMVALAGLVFFSSVAGSQWLVVPLEAAAPVLADPSAVRAQAIVVLAGGRLPAAPEYQGQDIPSYPTLARLRYAAHLARQTGLPVLLSGGVATGSSEAEAVTMQRVLQQDFGVSARWLETGSDNTGENARFTTAILSSEKIQRILLVTDAMHMRRSAQVFAAQGLEVVPAPTMFVSHDAIGWLDYLPRGEGQRRSWLAAHEWLGIARHRLGGWRPSAQGSGAAIQP
jgi:uncharacterized SAM-binding protein YcdF (DUF218 family)